MINKNKVLYLQRQTIYFTIMKKDLLKILFKVIVYAIGLLAAYFGVSAFASCSISREFKHTGVGYFQYYDTLHIHGTNKLYKDSRRYAVPR